MSWRRLGVLVRGLDGDTLETLGLSDRPAWGWDREYQRATIDAVNTLTWALLVVHSEKGKAPPEPEPTVRPWEETRADVERRRRLSMKEQLLAQRARLKRERSAD